MSLLLDALKKAEKAKEDAQRRAKGGGDQAGEPAPEETEAGKHVLTRPELPDISQPLEILSEDLQAKAAAPGLALEPDAPPPAAEPKPAAARRETPPRTTATAEAPVAERAAARMVFEAKYKEPNPRLPFYITMGFLGMFAVGTVGYFWYQLRPAAPLVNANPPRPSGEKPVDVAALKPATSAAAATPQATAAQTAIAGLPAAPAAPAVPARSEPVPVPAPAEKPAPAPVAQAAAPVERARPAPAAKRPAETVTVSVGAIQVHPRVQAGYGAYQSGDLTAARTEYQGALRDDPTNRDALLGLAAVEMRAQRYELSETHYLRLLELDPRDPNALAGLLALRGQAVDPVAAESRLKTLLAANPEAQTLNFALGNQYAQQGRWADAQAAYFKAFTADPENPDIAFNLAVSLDQLRQPKLALEYYQRALALAGKRAASFAPQAARERAQQLSR